MSRPQKHPRTGVYYFREKVPADLRSAFGRIEVSRTLRTKDPAEAKVRHAEEKRKQDRVWQTMRTKPKPLTQRDIEGLAGIYYRAITREHEDNPGDPDGWGYGIDIAGDLLGHASGRERVHGKEADHLLQEAGLTTDSDSRDRLLEAMNRAYLDAMQSLTKRAKGDYSPDMVIGRFPEAPRPESKAAKAAATLTGIFALWEREHLANGKSRKTAADFRQKIGSLREFVGHDDADRVTPEDVIAWSDKLRFENGLSARTVSSKYLVAVKTVFGLACQRKAMRSNPAKDFSIKVPKALRTRSKGFTDTEASAILSAALADPSSFGKKSAHLRMAIRWAPWICAHTGARVGEITQLRREDFLSEHGVLCIRITPEAGSVKTGNFRLVPLHPCLVEQGFPEFVQSRPEGPLFFQSKGEHDPKIRAGNMAKKVGEWVREEVGIRDLKVQPNYGWRHRFKTLARDAGIPPEYIDAIQGHEDGRASTGYGETTVKALRREIERFPRQG